MLRNCELSHDPGSAVSTFSLWLPFWNILAFLSKNASSFLIPCDIDETRMLLKPPQKAGQQVSVALTSGR